MGRLLCGVLLAWSSVAQNLDATTTSRAVSKTDVGRTALSARHFLYVAGPTGTGNAHQLEMRRLGNMSRVGYVACGDCVARMRMTQDDVFLYLLADGAVTRRNWFDMSLYGSPWSPTDGGVAICVDRVRAFLVDLGIANGQVSTFVKNEPHEVQPPAPYDLGGVPSDYYIAVDESHVYTHKVVDGSNWQVSSRDKSTGTSLALSMIASTVPIVDVCVGPDAIYVLRANWEIWKLHRNTLNLWQNRTAPGATGSNAEGIACDGTYVYVTGNDGQSAYGCIHRVLCDLSDQGEDLRVESTDVTTFTAVCCLSPRWDSLPQEARSHIEGVIALGAAKTAAPLVQSKVMQALLAVGLKVVSALDPTGHLATGVAKLGLAIGSGWVARSLHIAGIANLGLAISAWLSSGEVGRGVLTVGLSISGLLRSGLVGVPAGVLSDDLTSVSTAVLVEET